MPNKQIPLYGELTSAYGASTIADTTDPAKMPYYLNGFFERNTHALEDIRKVSYCKRPGTTGAVAAGITALTGLGNLMKIQGIINSFDKTKLIFYVNDGTNCKSYYFDGTTLTDKGAPTGTWTKTGPVAFTVLDGISYSASGFYAVTDFSEGAIVNTIGAWTRLTAATFTGLTKTTNFCAMDGYLFIGDDRNRIYNCNLNIPTTWTSTSFLTAADIPGKLMWLMRIKNYMAVFKQYSIEFFEDTGNPTPGSPLTAQKQLNRKVGLASKSSIKEVSDGIIFLGISEHGKIQVYKLNRDNLSLKVISNQFIEQTLDGFTKTDAAYSVDPKLLGVNGGEAQVINYRGKEFYTICLSNNGVDRTWVYDNQLDTWMRWATCMAVSGTIDSNFVPTQSTLFSKGGNLYNVMANNNFSAAGVPPFFTTISSTNLAFTDYIDDTTTSHYYPLEWVSDTIDFGSRKRKFMDSLEVLYDSYAGAGNVQDASNTVTLYYRDSDFNTAGTNAKLITRTINTVNDTTQRMIFRRLGSFRKRNIAIRQDDNLFLYGFRIWGVEIEYNIGETDQQG